MTNEHHAVTISIKTAGHEDLDDLLGGDEEGHYHVTAEELNYLIDKVAEKNAIDEGDEEERYGITETEYDKVLALIDMFFQDEEVDVADALKALIALNIKTLDSGTVTRA